MKPTTRNILFQIRALANNPSASGYDFTNALARIEMLTLDALRAEGEPSDGSGDPNWQAIMSGHEPTTTPAYPELGTVPTKPDFDTALAAFLAAAQAKVDAYYAKHQWREGRKLSAQLGGKRYVRITSDNGVYCFIDRTNGDVLKPRSWAAPEIKNPRSNIYDADHGAKGVDWHGAVYLR